jgi:NADPH:quinone reductase-like Zn-dependent oxidoreductase
MKALIIEKVGSPIKMTEVDNPVKRDGYSIVKLKASALNHRDIWITKGMYPGIKEGAILGSDGVGELDGRNVILNPGLKWGRNEAVQSDDFEVLGMPMNGTFAEYISIPNKYIYDQPVHLNTEEAAALPLAGLTAYRVLMSRCQAKSTDKILVTGTGGGVALFVVQFAVALGCDVYVTSGSDEKIAQAVALGAKGGYNYKNETWYKEVDTDFDVIIDSAGGPSFQHLVKICKPGARIGFYGASLGKYQNLNPQLLFWRQISLLGSTMGSDQDFRDMLAFVDEHKIKPVVDSVFSLEEGSKAFERMEAGTQFGKIVLKH